MKNQAQQEHHWLQQLAGEWTYQGKVEIAPGKPPGSSRERVRYQRRAVMGAVQRPLRDAQRRHSRQDHGEWNAARLPEQTRL